MDKEELFRWLVAYHWSINLDQHLRRVDKRHLAEGVDENESYRGILIVANGNTLIGHLQEDRVVLDSTIETPISTPKLDHFFLYLSGQRNGDGAYVFDSVNKRIVKVRELKNDVGNPNLRTDRYLPPDFLAHDTSVSLDEIGTKTRLAVRLPQAYPDTHALQIKRTAYGDFGMGKVTHFDHRGLAEEFYIAHDHSSEGPFLRPKLGLVGVYRQYDRQGDQVVCILEERVESLVDIAGYQRRREAA